MWNDAELHHRSTGRTAMQLTLIDYVIIVAYLAIILMIGLYFRKRAGSNMSEYFLSGRSLPWWVAGTSMVATTFAADTPLAVTGLVIQDGLAGNWFWWAFAFGGMITVFVYARLWRRAGVITDVELVEMRYGGKSAAALRGIRAVYIALIVNPIIIGWVTGAMVTLFGETILHGSTPLAVEVNLFGDNALMARTWIILFAALAFVGVYCTMSGMWGVAVTDAVQFVLAMAGCILLAYFAVRHLGGVENMRASVSESFGGDEAFSFIPNLGGEGAWMPVHVFLIMLLMQWWATWYPGAEPGGGGYVVQRMASCKDERHSVLATLWYAIAHYCVRPWPWLIVAFAALALYPELRASELADPSFDSGVGFPRVMRELSPPGLRGLLLVTFFAAFMSTISTQMNWGASYLVRDVYQRFMAPDASDVQLTSASRFASLLVLVVGGGTAFWMRDISVDGAWKMLAALGAGTGAVFMLRWFWWRINAWSEISSMVASLVFYLAIEPPEFAKQVGVKPLLSTLGFAEELRSEETMLVVAVLTIATWLLVTFITPPESDEVLDSFYRKVRPGGVGWGPVAERNPNVQVDTNLVLSLVAAVAATGIVYSTLPMIGHVIFGNAISALGCGAVALVCSLIVAMLVRKLVQEPERN